MAVTPNSYGTLTPVDFNKERKLRPGRSDIAPALDTLKTQQSSNDRGWEKHLSEK